MHARARATASSAVVALLIGLSLALSGGVAGAIVPSAVVTPGGVGPPAALSTTTLPLANVGYQSTEFYLAGNARSYNTGGNPFLADGLWTVAADATTQPFKTRAQVYRPIDPAEFNGTVIVEWLNVTNQSDSAADWIVTHVEQIREGTAYVLLTTQAIGVNAARTADPTRYGAAGANLLHPGDSFSYDIFSQGGKAVRDNQALMLGGLALNKLIAYGESQSATRLVTYIDALAKADGVYDGYLVHSRGATGAALRGNPPGTIATPGPTLIRTDLTQPVFVFQTETDTRNTRQSDTATFRQWEVAGSAHADLYTLGPGQVDEGVSPDNPTANTMFDAMLHPVPEPLPGILGPCTFGVNSGPHHWALQAASFHLNNWVTNGTLPPSGGPGLATAGGVPSAALVLDTNGNATGGVRSPHVDVPVATIRGSGNTSAGPGINFCGLFGTTTPFSDAKLLSLYPNHTAFVNAWNASVDAGVTGGYILAADAPMLKFSAAASNVGEHVRAVAGNSRSSSSNNNITATVGAEGVAVGDTAVVSVATGTFAGTVGCSDTKGNAYTVVADKNTGHGRLFTCSSTLATTLGTGDVVTATYPGFSGLSVVSVTKILAYATTGITDGVSTASGSNPPVNSGTINTAHAADLLFGVVAHTSPSTFTPGSGFQIVGQVSGGSGSGKKTVSPMFKAVYSIGPYSATGTLSGSGFWQAALIGYQSP